MAILAMRAHMQTEMILMLMLALMIEIALLSGGHL
jgi:hypothetical protein